MTPEAIVEKSRRAALYVGRRQRSRDDRYELGDMIQDGCVAVLQGRQPYYGIVDGLRRWMGRKGGRYVGREDPVTLDFFDVGYPAPQEQRLLAKEQLEEHYRRLERLEPKRRSIYLLHRHDGKPVREICQIFELHQTRVHELLRQADAFMGKMRMD